MKKLIAALVVGIFAFTSIGCGGSKAPVDKENASSMKARNKEKDKANKEAAGGAQGAEQKK